MTIEASEWEKIETAPKDRSVLVWTGKNMYCAIWVKNFHTDNEAWMIARTDDGELLVVPTHWQELPKPPQ